MPPTPRPFPLDLVRLDKRCAIDFVRTVSNSYPPPPALPSDTCAAPAARGTAEEGAELDLVASNDLPRLEVKVLTKAIGVACASSCKGRVLLGEGGGGGGGGGRAGEGGDWGWGGGGGGGNDDHLRRRRHVEPCTAPDPRGAAEDGVGLGDLAASDDLPGDEMSVVTKAIDFACAGGGRVCAQRGKGGGGRGGGGDGGSGGGDGWDGDGDGPDAAGGGDWSEGRSESGAWRGCGGGSGGTEDHHARRSGESSAHPSASFCSGWGGSK